MPRGRRQYEGHRRAKAKSDKPDLEASFLLWLRQHPSIPEAVREHKFALPRQWRFDFAWPDQRIAVEIDGGLWQNGRHQTLSGTLGDCEKYEAALARGWRVYRVPGPWIAEGERSIWRPQVIETLKTLLGVLP